MLPPHIIDRIRRDRDDREDRRIPLYLPLPEPPARPSEPPASDRRGSCDVDADLSVDFTI